MTFNRLALKSMCYHSMRYFLSKRFL